MTPVRRYFPFACLGMLAAAGLLAPRAQAADPEASKEKPKVEVVFCLDTTGSMGGLIEGARQKIWAICNQVASGKPTPDLRVGLVAYRDRGDAYVARVFDLSADLDAVYGHLKDFQAQGGGDGPEAVNEALADSVRKISWSKDKGTLKILFLVGDAPPHMDYKDDTKYMDTCQLAVKNDIIINTIQCGGDPECTRFWKDICTRAEGSYAAIPQSGGVVAIATPFDARLAAINGELARTTVAYGTRKTREAAEAKADVAAKLAPSAAADRASFAGRSGGSAGEKADLLRALKDGKVKLSEIKDEELPEQLAKMTPEERKAHVEKLEKRRAELSKEAVELDRKRQEFIKQKLAEKKGSTDSFDSQVLEMLRKQATRAGIAY